MTLTPAKLDAIATKLLGWTKFMDGVFKRDPDDTEYCGRLSPADAMLVLEAMDRWCEKQEGNLWYVKLYSGCGWCCQIEQAASESDGCDVMVEGEPCDTIPAAAFACAAQLVERM